MSTTTRGSWVSLALLTAGLVLSAMNAMALASMTVNVLTGGPDVASVAYAIGFLLLALMSPALALRAVRAGQRPLREARIDAAARALVVGGLLVFLLWVALLGITPP